MNLQKKSYRTIGFHIFRIQFTVSKNLGFKTVVGVCIGSNTVFCIIHFPYHLLTWWSDFRKNKIITLCSFDTVVSEGVLKMKMKNENNGRFSMIPSTVYTISSMIELSPFITWLCFWDIVELINTLMCHNYVDNNEKLDLNFLSKLLIFASNI